MSKKPALPAELMARHLDYRTTDRQQAAYLSAYQRWQDQQHHEALRVLRRIEGRQAEERAIRASRDWCRAPEPNRVGRLLRRVALGLSLIAGAAGVALLVGGGG